MAHQAQSDILLEEEQGLLVGGSQSTLIDNVLISIRLLSADWKLWYIKLKSHVSNKS